MTHPAPAREKPSGEAPSSFKFTKALSGAASSSSACSTRGDGKFEGGASFHQRGNVVTLSADALAPENAEATLKQIDDMQATAASRGRRGKPEAGRVHEPLVAARGVKQEPEPTAKQHHQLRERLTRQAGDAEDDSLAGLSQLFEASDLSRMQLGKVSSRTLADIPGNALFDISDADSLSRSSTTGTGKASSSDSALPTPHHSLVTLPADVVVSLPQRFELTVELPLLEHVSQAVVDVEPRRVVISFPGFYSTLRVSLPQRVGDDQTKAKWNKGKRVLVLTLPVVG
ncbi:MAG: hypothetical protein WDW38_008814 [Sanguina aurantia]